jgi:hypothetical protein
MAAACRWGVESGKFMYPSTFGHVPPYLPDLAPCDFWLFWKLENALKGERFADIPDIQRTVITLLRGIPENDFQDCFRQGQHRLTKCIAS